MHTPKETNNEMKTKRSAFSLVSGADVEESAFSFSAELKIPYHPPPPTTSQNISTTTYHQQRYIHHHSPPYTTYF